MNQARNRRCRRMALVGLVVGALCVFAAMMVTASRLRGSTGDQTVRVGFGVPIFVAQRIGHSTTLAPRGGVLVILLGLPAAFAGGTFLVCRRRAPPGACQAR